MARWLSLYGCLAGLHLLMLGYDLGHPDRFLRADRAGSRMEVIEGFVREWHSGGDVAGYVAGHGIVGDWLPQALLYLWGGQYAVIAVQVTLALLAVAWVRAIGIRLGLGARAAGAAALLYGLLPHALVPPHQLASEAIFVPMLLSSFALLARAAQLGRGYALAGALLGAATLVRPITLLWPLVCVPFLGGPARSRAGFVAAAAAPLALWTALVFAATGEVSLGRSDHDLGRNLYERAALIAAAAGVPAPPDRDGDRRLSVSAYLRFAAGHPAASLAHGARDVLVLGANPGFERIALDYLDRAPSGLAAAAGAAAFAGLMLLALAGGVAWMRGGAAAPPLRGLRAMLALFPLYVFATAQAVDAAQSRHRAPAEIALCLLAAAGLPAPRRGERP